MIKSIARLLLLPLLCASFVFSHSALAAPDACQITAAAGTNLRTNGIKYNAGYSAVDPFGAIPNCPHGTGGLGATDNAGTVDILEHPNAVQFNMFRDNTTWGILKQRVTGANQQAAISNATALGRLSDIDERQFLAIQTPIGSGSANLNSSGTLSDGDTVRLYMIVHNNAQQICGVGGNTAQNVQVSIDWNDVANAIQGQIQADNMFLSGSGVGQQSIFDNVGGISLPSGATFQKAGPINIQRQTDPNSFYCNGNPITYTTLTEGVNFASSNITYDQAGGSITVNLGNLNGSNGNIHYVYFDLQVITPSINIEKDDSTPGTTDTDGDDTQTVNQGGTATFTVEVTNNGGVALTNVIISDTEAPNCARNPVNPALYAGGATANFDPGEFFSYNCTATNVQPGDFTDSTAASDAEADEDPAPGNDTPDNDISVQATPVGGGANVTDENVTQVVVIPGNPSIDLDKDDNDNSDDTQTVNVGGTAQFTLTVTNDGNVALENIVLTEPENEAPNCVLTSSETEYILTNGISGTNPTGHIISFDRTGLANADDTLEVGEFFSYVCEQTNVQTTTFNDNDNDARVDGTAVGSGTPTFDNDPTTVTVLVPSIIVDKDDSTPGTVDTDGDDSQTVMQGGTAIFTIAVTNDGAVALENVDVTESENEAPNCTLSQAQVEYILTNGASGTNPVPQIVSFSRAGLVNTNDTLEVGETFSYVCERDNVQPSTFNNNDNDIQTTGDPVGGGTEVMDVDDTVVLVTPANPSIDLDKDDNDNTDDTQTVNVGGTAQFTLTVTNDGNVALEDLVITEPENEAPNCALTASETEYILTNGGSGTNPGGHIVSFNRTGLANADSALEVGESFSYVCEHTNVQTNTFTDDDNDARVDATSVGAGTPVNDIDDTEVLVLVPSILVDKDDSTPGTADTDGDDTQTVMQGGTATFTVEVTNDGAVDLENVTVTESENEAPNCTLNASQVEYILTNGGSGTDPVPQIVSFNRTGLGNTDNILQVGESFFYVCQQTNVQTNTFINNDNDIQASGDPVGGGTPVMDPDDTQVLVTTENPQIQLEKDDSTPGTVDTDGDDTQNVNRGNTATFTFIVSNTGNVALENLVITEPENEAPNCALTASETEYILTNGASGTDPSGHIVSFDRTGLSGTTATLPVGDSFSYVCEQANVQANTFTDDDNDGRVDATSVGMATPVFDEDPTDVFVLIPSIIVDKDDSTPGTVDTDGDDTQTVIVGGTATFTVAVTNNGAIDLENVDVTESENEAPNCTLSEAQVEYILTNGASGTNPVPQIVSFNRTGLVNTDNILQIGETFSYVCQQTNVQTTTFIDDDNDIQAEGDPVGGGTPVMDPDDTQVLVNAENPVITLEKDDSTPGTVDTDGDDTQTVFEGGTATFTFIVGNGGNVALENIVLSEPENEAPDCALTASQTEYILTNGASGTNPVPQIVSFNRSGLSGTTATLPVGESFSYVCERDTVLTTTFTDDDNDGRVDATSVGAGTPVFALDPTTVLVTPAAPSIQLDKDDADNSDDTQSVAEGGTAQFTLTVTNNGNVALENIVLTETENEAPNCALTASETEYILTNGGSGTNPGGHIVSFNRAGLVNADSALEVGESFSYVCEQTGVTSTTFTDDDNDARVDATSIPLGTGVFDTDDTEVLILDPSILVDKDDSTPGTVDTDGDDTQTIMEGGTATFTIEVTNNGGVALENVALTETENEAPNCTLSALEVEYILTNGITGSNPNAHIVSFDRTGLSNADNALEVGESFSYVCEQTNVQTNTFTDDDNDIRVIGDPVGGGTQVSDDDDTEVLVTPEDPVITLDKDDNDNSDDTQSVNEGGTAQFTLTVTNAGNVDLENIALTEPENEAPDCALSIPETTYILTNGASGTDPSSHLISFDRGGLTNTDAVLEVGESFSYVCEVANVQTTTFTDDDNDARVDATSIPVGTPVFDEDPSTVIVLEASIDLIKDDNDNSDDTQTVNVGGTAQFTLTVTNDGTADLENLAVTETENEAPNCVLTTAETEFILTNGASGTDPASHVVSTDRAGLNNSDAVFEPGESFSYVCEIADVQTSTFNDNDNDARVDATPVGGGAGVFDEDPSEVLVLVPSIIIDKDDSTPGDADTDGDDTQTILEGSTATFTIEVTNNGATDLENVIIIETESEAPNCELTAAETEYILTNGASGTDPSGHIVSFDRTGLADTDAILQIGESFIYVCELENVQLDSFFEDDNDIDVTGSPVGGGTDVMDLDDTEVLVTPVEPGIELIKDDNDNNDDTQVVTVGDNAEFTFTVRNTGNVAIENISVSETEGEAPNCALTTDEVTYILTDGASGTDPSGHLISIDRAGLTGTANELPVGESFSYVCEMTNVQLDTFIDNDNDAQVDGTTVGTGTPVSDEDPSTVLVANIDIVKDDADNSDDTQAVINGQEATFTITVTNDGSANLNEVIVADVETPNCALTTANSEYILTNGASGTENTNVTVTNRVSDDDAIFEPNESFAYTCSTVGLGILTFVDGDNDADVTATIIDNTPDTVTDTDPSEVTFLNGAIDIDKDDADNTDDTQEVNIGETATFTITVSNDGTADIDEVFVADAQASNCALTIEEVEYILTDGASGTDPSSHIVSFDRTGLNNTDAILQGGTPGESFSFVCERADVQVDTFANNLNLASVSGETVVGDSTVTDEDTSEVTVNDTRVGEIEITKTSDPVSGSQVNTGSTITYTLTVENVGPLDLVNVEITDQLDTKVTFDPDPQTGIDHTNGTVTITVGDLAVGESQSFDFTVRVNDNATGTIENQGSVTGEDTNSNPVSDTSEIVIHTLPTGGGGGGGGGSAPVITAIPVCLEHPITGQVQITDVRPDRYGPNWDYYTSCLNDPTISEEACVYEWAAYTEYLFPFDNGLCVPPVTTVRPTPFVGTTCVDAFACPGCLNNEDGEPVIQKSIVGINGEDLDVVAVRDGEQVTYRINVNFVPLNINEGFDFVSGKVRVYDYTVSEESGKLWYRDGLVDNGAGWTQHGDAAAGGIYFEKDVSASEFHSGSVALEYVMDTELMDANNDTDRVVNNAFAIFMYDYDQIVEELQPDNTIKRWSREFHQTLGLNEEICADSHYDLSALYNEVSTYGDKAEVQIVRPFIQGQGGDIAMTQKIAGNAEKVIDSEINAGRVIDTVGEFDDQTTDTVYVDEADNFADIENLEQYYSYLADTATPFDASADLGVGTNNGLLLVDTPIVLNGTYTFTEPTTLIVQGGTVDIMGNVSINGDNFLGVVVLDGTINISDEVTELQGAYIAEDLDKSGDDGNFVELPIKNEELQLSVDGMLAGNLNQLLEAREYIGTSADDIQPNIKLNFDIRMLDATPPGLEKALGTDWGQK